MRKAKFIIALGILTLVFACNQKKSDNKNADTVTAPDSTKENSTKEVDNTNYQSETTSEETAQKLKNYIVESFLKPEDLKVLKVEDRKFSFYEVDLNGDSKDEYFVKLEGNYFRGTGGGTFLLLSHDLKLINLFTVMNEPVFRTSSKTNGWNDLILYGDYSEKEGVTNYIHLRYDKATQKYPSNPSLINKIDIAPNGHDFVMWHNEFSKAKVFEF